MIKRENFRFQVSVSVDAYTDKIISNAMIGSTKVAENRRIRKKYGFKANKGVGYMEGTYTPQELLDQLTEGHVVCNLFNYGKTRKDGTFGSRHKKVSNFRASYMIGVDIDETQYDTAEDFIGRLELKPTFYYTSYSNQQEGKGARFRMMYVLDKPIRDPYHFRYFSLKLHSKIEADTQEKIHDKCGLVCSQYFNGTYKDNKDSVFSCGITNTIYEFKDFSPTKGDFLDYLNNNCYYRKSLSKEEKSDIRYLKNIIINSNSLTTYYDDWQKNEHFAIESDSAVWRGDQDIVEDKESRCSDRLVSDMSRLDYEEFMKYNRHKYCFFYRVEREDWITFNDMVSYQEVGEDYFSLYYHSKRICDKQKRRKKLYQRMCLRRVMKPNVDADTLLFNAYEDLHRFCDNDHNSVGNVITVEELVRNVHCAMNKDIEDIETELSDTIGYLKSKRPKFGRIYKFKHSSIGVRNSLIKELNWTMIAENYNCSATLKENLQALQKLNIRVSERTLYRFCKEYKIETKVNDDSELMEHYDHSLSLRKNLILLKGMGYKVSLGRLSRLVKESISPLSSIPYINILYK